MQISVQSAKQNLGIEPAPHLHCAVSTQRIMLYVVCSLIPALAVITYFFGFGTLVQFVISAVTALLCQMLANLLHSRPILKACKDPSGLVTAILLAITLPPLLPWYLTVIATVFAMLIVRECFGGLGMNLFNPAMSGFIFLVVSCPSIFYSTWVAPAPSAFLIANPSRVCEVIFQGHDAQAIVQEIKALNLKRSEARQENALSKLHDEQDEQNKSTVNEVDTKEQAQQEAITKQILVEGDIKVAGQMDALTGATFLESIKTARKAGNVEDQVKVDFKSDSFIAYAYLAGAYVLGGLFLIIMRVIRFQVPLSFIVTIGALGALWHHLDPNLSISAVEHLLMGGTMLGAFYIITDPVTTCGTFKGRILFSIIIAVLVIVIRVYGSYSDSVAFAVMLGNCIAPLMDVMTKRRPFGIGYRHGGLD